MAGSNVSVLAVHHAAGSTTVTERSAVVRLSNTRSIRRRLGGWQRLSLLSRTCDTSGYVATASVTDTARADLAVAARSGAQRDGSGLVRTGPRRPLPEAALVQWVSLTAWSRSATPRRPMTGDQVRRRHVCVDSAAGYRRPGLVIAWRRRGDGPEWEAYVAQAHGDGSALITWGTGDQPAPGDRRRLAARSQRSGKIGIVLARPVYLRRNLMPLGRERRGGPRCRPPCQQNTAQEEPGPFTRFSATYSHSSRCSRPRGGSWSGRPSTGH